MRKGIPNTEIYLDTSDFYFTSTPNETEIEMSDRFIVSEDRDGSSKEQTISGTLSITENLNVTNKLTCGSFEITESELTVKHLSVSSDSSDDIWLKVSAFGKLYTPKIYSVFDQTITENAYAKINLQKYSPSDPSKIEFVIPRRESSSYRTSTYRMTKDGFYCVDSHNASTSLGTISNYWTDGYITNIHSSSITSNSLSIQSITGQNSSAITEFTTISGKKLIGNPSSLYSISGSTNMDRLAENGALFLGRNFNQQNPQAGSMTIFLISLVIKGSTTDTYRAAWLRSFTGKYIWFRRGVDRLSLLFKGNDGKYYVDNNCTLKREYSSDPKASDSYIASYSVPNQNNPSTVDYIAELEFKIGCVRSLPLLYNSLVLTIQIEDTRFNYADALKIDNWDAIAFINESRFELAENIETYTFNAGVFTNCEVESDDRSYNYSSLLVMKVGN